MFVCRVRTILLFIYLIFENQVATLLEKSNGKCPRIAILAHLWAHALTHTHAHTQTHIHTHTHTRTHMHTHTLSLSLSHTHTHTFASTCVHPSHLYTQPRISGSRGAVGGHVKIRRLWAFGRFHRSQAQNLSEFVIRALFPRLVTQTMPVSGGCEVAPYQNGCNNEDVFAYSETEQPESRVIFAREGRWWNLGGTWQTHERFLSEISRQDTVGAGQLRQRGVGPRISVLIRINNLVFSM